MTAIADLFAGEPQLVVTAVRGYRSWSIDPSTGALASTGVDHIWGVPRHLAITANYFRQRQASVAAMIGPIANSRVDARCLRNQMHRGPAYGGCTCPACIVATTQPLHAAPQAGCSCGIYGWYDPGDTRIVPSVVYGAVEASGRMILGTHGFRAERARVLAVVATGKPGIDEPLAILQYRLLPDRDALLTEYPPDDMSGLVDHDCDRECTMARSLILGSSGTFAQLQAAAAYSISPPPPPVPRWKRWPLVAGSAAGLATCVFGLGLSASSSVKDWAWTHLVTGVANAVGIFFWRRNLRSAWRWR